MDPVVGQGKYTYKVDEAWAQVPEWLELKPAAVSVDSEDGSIALIGTTPIRW